MTARPECKVPGCKNEGLVFLSNQLVCGDCILKLQERRREQLMEELGGLVDNN